MFAGKHLEGGGILDLLLNSALSKGLLAINGAGNAGFKVTNALDFMIDGVAYQKAAAGVGAFNTTGLVVHGPSQSRYYLVQIDSGGNFSTKQGDVSGPVPLPGTEGGYVAATLMGKPQQANGLAYARATGAITAITAAFPPQITSATHGLQTGDKVRLDGISGMVNLAGGKQGLVSLNGQVFQVKRIDANNFTLVGIDASAATPWVSGGFWTEDRLARCPVGAILVVTNGATTFTPATTLLDAAGITVTYFDFGNMGYNLFP